METRLIGVSALAMDGVDMFLISSLVGAMVPTSGLPRPS